MAEDFNTSTKKILNTATGEKESNPIDGTITTGEPIQAGVAPASTPELTPFPTEAMESSGPLEAGGVEFQDFSGVDKAHTRAIDPLFSGVQENINANVQSNWDKLGNTIISGASKGTIAAFEPVLSVLGAGFGMLDEDYEKAITRLDDNLKKTIATNFQTHESIMNPGDSLLDTWENFARFSTAESIVESAVQFGILGAGAGAVTRGMGSLLLRAGGSYQKIASAGKVANQLQKTLGTAGRYMSKPVEVFGIKSNAVAQGLMSNYLEGRVMADEIGHEMQVQYAKTLNDPTVSQEVKQTIMDGIADAQTDMQVLNTALAFNDIIGFSRLGNIINAKGMGFKGLKKFTKDGLPLFSLSEGLEENLQNQISAYAKQNSQVGIERKYAAGNEKVQGIEGISLDNVIDSDKPAFTPENTLLWANDPEAANAIAVDNARTLGGFLMEHAASKQAMVETMSGFVGGGPQWLITGAPRKILHGKAETDRAKAQEEYLGKAAKMFESLAVADIKSEANLSEVLTQIQSITPEGADDSYLKDVLEDYLVANTVLTSIKNGNSESLTEYFEEQSDMNQQALSDGTITQEQYDLASKRVDTGKDMLKEYKNYATYANYEEMLSNALEVKAREASIKAAESAMKRQAEVVEQTPEEVAAEAAVAEEVTETNEEPVIDEEEVVTPETPPPPVSDDETTDDTEDDEIINNTETKAQLEKEHRNAKELNEYIDSFPDDNLSSEEESLIKNAKNGLALVNGEIAKLEREIASSEGEIRKSKDAAHEQRVRNRRADRLDTLAEISGTLNEAKSVENPNASERYIIEAYGKRYEEVSAELIGYDKYLDEAGVDKELVEDGVNQTPEQWRGMSATEILKATSGDKAIDKEALGKLKSPVDRKDITPPKENLAETEEVEDIEDVEEVQVEEEVEETPTAVIDQAYIDGLKAEKAKYEANIKYIMSPEGQIKAIQNQRVAGKYTDKLTKILRSKNLKYVSGQVAKLQGDLNKTNNPHEAATIRDLMNTVKAHRDALRTKQENTKSTPKDNSEEEEEADNTETSNDSSESEYGDNADGFSEPGDGEEVPKEGEGEEVPDQEPTETDPENQQLQEVAQEVVSRTFKNKDEAESIGNDINDAAEEFNEDIVDIPLENLDDPYTEDGQKARAKAQTVFKFASDVLNSFANIAPGAPVNFDALLAITAQIPNVDIEKAEPLLRMTHAAWSGIPFSETHSHIKKKVFKNTSDDKYDKPVKNIVKVDDVTTASFVTHGPAIAYDGDITPDFNKVKKGTKLKFRVIKDLNEIEANEAYNTVYVNSFDGKTQIPYTWDKLRKLKAEVDKNGGKDKDGNLSPIASSDYNVNNMYPIEVLLADNEEGAGEKIGHIHTAQWVTKYRSDKNGVQLPKSDTDKVLLATTVLRESIILGKTDGHIQDRKGNIQKTESYFKGTALSFRKGYVNDEGEQIDGYDNTGDVLGGADAGIHYAVINKDGVLMDNVIEGEKKLNKNVEFIYPNTTPDRRRLGDIAEPGSVVALVPLEDSNIKVVVKMLTAKVEKDVFGYMTKRLSELMVDKDNTYPPENIKRAFTSIMATDHIEGKPADTFKMNVTVNKGKFIVKGYHKSKKWTLNYSVVRTPIGSSGKYKNIFTLDEAEVIDSANSDLSRNYTDRNVQEGFSEFRAFMTKVNAAEENRPFYNVEQIKLWNAQYGKKSSTSVVRVEKGKIKQTPTSYVDTVIHGRTKTNLKTPKPIGNDQFNYTHNTIITIALDTSVGAKKTIKVIKKKADTQDTEVGNAVEVVRLKKKVKGLKEILAHVAAIKGLKVKDSAAMLKTLMNNDKVFAKFETAALLRKTTVLEVAELVTKKSLSKATKDITDFTKGTRKSKDADTTEDLDFFDDDDFFDDEVPTTSTPEPVAIPEVGSNMTRATAYNLMYEQGFISEDLKYKGETFANKSSLERQIYTDLQPWAEINGTTVQELSKQDVLTYIGLDSFKAIVKANEQFQKDNEDANNPDLIIEDNMKAASVAAYDETPPEVKKDLPKTPKDLQIVKIALRKYAYKAQIKDKSGFAPKPRLNAAEEDTVSDAVSGIFMRGFRESGYEDLLSKDLPTFVAASKNAIEENIRKTITDLNKLVASGSLDNKDILKAGQQIEVLTRLLSKNDIIDKSTGEMGNRKLGSIINIGIDRGITELGFVKSKNVSDIEIGDTETFAANYSIMKNPKEGMTAKLRSKISTYFEYSVSDEGIVVDVDLTGSPITRNNMFEKLAEIFEVRTTNNYAEKLSILKEQSAKLAQNEARYVDIKFIDDMIADLETKGTSNTFTNQDKRSFNRAFNKDMSHARGLGLSKGKNKKIIEEDPNFSSKFTKIMSQLSEKIEQLKRAGNTDHLVNLLQKGSDYRFVTKNNVKALEFLPDITLWLKDQDALESLASEATLINLTQGMDSITAFVDNWLTLPDYRNEEFKDTFGVNLFTGTGEKKVMTKEAKQIITGLQGVKRTLAEEVASRVASLLNYTGVDMRADSRDIMVEAMMMGEVIDMTTYNGEKTGKQNYISSAIRVFVEQTIEILNDPKKVPKQGYRSFIHWITSRVGSVITAATVRLGKKIFGIINDPIALNQGVRELKSETKGVMNQGIMSNKSRVLAVKNGQVISDAPWLQTIFDKAYRIIKPTWESDLDKADSPYQHMLFTLGSYLESIEFNRKDDGVQVPGTKYDTMTDTIGGQNYTLNVRAAKFQTPTFSDKDTIFNMDGIDFDATERSSDGTPSYKQKFVEYWIDSVVVPELNRIAKMSDKDNVVSGYRPELIYSLPSLNKDTRIMSLIAKLNLGNEELLSLFSPSHTTATQTLDHSEAIKELRALVQEAVQEEFVNGVESYIELMVENGLISVTDNGYQLSKELSGIKTFNNLAFEVGGKNAPETAVDLTTLRQQASANIAGQFEDFISKNENDIIVWETPHDILDAFSHNLTSDISLREELSTKATELEEKFSPAEAAEFMLIELGFNINAQKAIAISNQGKLISNPSLSKSEKEKAINTAAKLFEKSYKGSPYISDSFSSALTEKADLQKKASVTEGKSGTTISEKSLRHIIMNRQFGYTFAQANMTQLFYGDVAFFYKQAGINNKKNNPEAADWGTNEYNYIEDIYATYDNLGKRLAKEVSPGVFSEGSTKSIYLAIKEPKRKSLFYNEQSKKDGTYVDVGTMEFGDAASYVTINSRLQHLLFEGSITEEQAPWIKKYFNGTDGEHKFTGAMLDAKFPGLSKKVVASTDKPRHVEFEVVEQADGTILRVPFYNKVAETVLTDNLIMGTVNNNALAKIKRMMEQVEAEENSGEVWENVEGWTSVRLSPPSGIKTGGRDALIDVMSSEGIQPDAKGKFLISENSKIRVTAQGYARQVRTDYKEGKEVKTSGQVENLVWNSVGINTAIRKRWNAVIAKGYEYGFDVLDSLFADGLSEEAATKILENDTADTTAFEGIRDNISDRKISNLIRASLRAQNNNDLSVLNPNMLEWLRIDPATGKFEQNLADSIYFTDFMDIIRVSYEKKTVKAKRNGSQLPLKSGLGYDLTKAGMGNNQIYIFNKADIDPSGRLRPQMEGKPAQILVPFDFTWRDEAGNKQNLILKDYLVTDKKTGRTMVDQAKLPKELFEQMGYRTPTQDYSMMSYVEVVGFMPPAYLNSVVAPDEFTKLMGSDFDIDKLFTYKYNLTKGEDGSLRIITMADGENNPHFRKLAIDNEKLKIINEVLNTPTIVKNEIVQQLNGEDEFKEFANENYDMIRKGTHDRQSYLGASFQETKRNNAAGGKQAIGVWASLSRFTAQIRNRKVPFFAYNSETEKMEAASFQLGSSTKATVKHMASGRLPIFRNNPNEADSVYHKLKNNISAFISIAVDNEQLQMIHKLGMGQHSYTRISALLVAGFNGKSALAIANQLIHSPEINTNTMKSKLVKAYNSDQRKNPNKTKISAGGNGKGEVVTSKEFTLLQEGMTEEAFTTELISLNERVRKAYKGDGLISLSSTDIKNVLALYDFTNKVTTSLEGTYKPFQWVVNQDSAGFKRNIKGLYQDMHNTTEDSKYSKVWEEYDKVPEMHWAKKATSKYFKVMSTLNTPASAVAQVMTILKNSDAQLQGQYFLTTYLNRAKYRSLIPNIDSLTSRLDVIRASMHPDAISFRDNNPFFNNLVVTKKSISFRKSESLTPKTVIDALESIARYPDIAGIDMNLLHNDLIAYGMTSIGNTLGDSMLPYIKPKYFKKGDFTLDDPTEAAAYAAWKNIDGIAISGEKDDKSKIRKVRNANGDFEIRYWNETDQEFAYMNEAKEKTLYGLSQEEKIEALFYSSNEDVVGENDGDIGAINLSKTMERVLSHSSMIPFKKMMDALLPDYLQGVKSTKGNEWRPDAHQLVLTSPKYWAALKANLVHEGTHAVLQKAISAFEQGLLGKVLPGKNGDGKVIQDEFSRAATSLDKARIDSLKGIVKSATRQFDTLYRDEKPNDTDADYTKIAFGVMYNLGLTEFNNGMDFRDFLTEEDIKKLFGTDENYSDIQEHWDSIASSDPEELSRTNIDASQLKVMKLYGFMKAKKGGRISIQKKPAGNMMVLKRADGKMISGDFLEQDAWDSMKDFLTHVDNGIGNTKAFVESIVQYSMQEDDYKAGSFVEKERTWYQQLMYGTQNLHEFTSNAYSYGVSSKDTAARREHFGYTHFAEYYGALNSPLPPEIAGIFNKAFKIIKDLIASIVGWKNTNTLWQDVLYMKTLSKFDTFVLSEKNGDKTQGVVTNSYSRTDIAEDILKTCKTKV